ncbi:hypothetical protein B6264_25865 [Kitasatospora aureofaciens]|nr:hypothetical protein B6264_25865 [Kitasatospora aureofaciens]
MDLETTARLYDAAAVNSRTGPRRLGAGAGAGAGAGWVVCEGWGAVGSSLARKVRWKPRRRWERTAAVTQVTRPQPA